MSAASAAFGDHLQSPTPGIDPPPRFDAGSPRPHRGPGPDHPQ